MLGAINPDGNLRWLYPVPNIGNAPIAGPIITQGSMLLFGMYEAGTAKRMIFAVGEL